MKPKVLYIFTPGFAADETDTTCIPFLQQFCLSFKKANPDIKMVIFTFQYPYTTKDYHWNGIRVQAFGGGNKKGLPRIILWLKIINRFAKLRRESEVLGIFSVWLSECALVGKILSSWYDIKHFTWIVGQDARATNKYVKWIHPRSENLVAFSKFIAEQMVINFGLLPKHIIRNGININIFPALKTENRGISIMGAGSLIALKNFSLFIRVIERISQKFPMVKAVIAGDGPERENLRLLIEERQLKDVIELAGNMEHKGVLALMNNSQMFLHTSQYDSNATGLHEALCAGCTVISTCPIDPTGAENFFLVKDEDEMAAKVIELLSYENTGYKRVLMNTMDNSAKEIAELFVPI